MSEFSEVVSPEGLTVPVTRLSREEIAKSWEGTSEGVRLAKARGPRCFVIGCPDRDRAIELSAAFAREVSQLACAHWDGQTLSLYCEPGTPASQAEACVWRYVAIGWPQNHWTGPLFADEASTPAMVLADLIARASQIGGNLQDPALRDWWHQHIRAAKRALAAIKRNV